MLSGLLEAGLFLGVTGLDLEGDGEWQKWSEILNDLVVKQLRGKKVNELYCDLKKSYILIATDSCLCFDLLW